MPRLLLIDDDERLAELLRRFFERYDMTLDSALLPSDGLAMLHSRQYDLVILDIMLPEMDGFEVCKTIRKDSSIPIIMLTARGEVMDRIVGLELGADDYLPKPFEPRELVARINTVLKRLHTPAADESPQQLRFEQLSIDLQRQEVRIDQQLVPLSSSEYALLLLLAQQPGKVFSRDEILNRLKGIEVDIYSRAVDILISRLRQKLKPATLIKTVRGSGYCFVGSSL